MENKISKIKEASRIIMSIDNLYTKCITRDQRKQGIKYFAGSKDSPSDFNDFPSRFQFSLEQLESVEKHMIDYDIVLKELEQDPRMKQIMNSNS